MVRDLANKLKEQLATLTFLDKVGGVVRPLTYTVIDGEKSIRKVIPIDAGATLSDCKKGKYREYVPDSKYKSIMYFEDLGTRFIEKVTGGQSFESTMKLVCWMNLRKMGKMNYEASSAAILDILNTIPKQNINSTPYTRIKFKVTGQDVKSQAIFSKYTYDESVIQYLMYPFDYFALTIVASFVIPEGCIQDWQNQVEICENFDGAEPDPVYPCPECPEGMVADFTVNDTAPTVGDTIKFTDQTTNNPTDWQWTFTQGSMVTKFFVQNPSINVTTTGTITVELIAVKDGAGDKITKIDYVTVSAPAYEPEAIALFSRMASVGEEPDMSRKIIINTLYVGLKNVFGLDLGEYNIDTVFDYLRIYASHGEQASKKNLIKDDHHAVFISGPTFTNNQGLQGDGFAKYARSNYNAFSQGVNYTLNNGCYFTWSLTNIVENSIEVGCTNASSFIQTRVRTDGSMCDPYINNSSTSHSFSTGTSLGLTATDREDNSNFKVYKNGLLIQSVSQSSSAIPDLEWYELGRNFNSNLTFPSTRKVSIIGSCRSLTDLEHAGIYNVFLTYLTDVGAV